MSWPAPPPREAYVLRLFVAGTTMRSQSAITNVRSICEQHLPNRFELEVIDVYTHPQQTRDLQIVATPTLVKLEPKPLTMEREATRTFVQHHEIIEGQRAGKPLTPRASREPRPTVLPGARRPVSTRNDRRRFS